MESIGQWRCPPQAPGDGPGACGRHYGWKAGLRPLGADLLRGIPWPEEKAGAREDHWGVKYNGSFSGEDP